MENTPPPVQPGRRWPLRRLVRLAGRLSPDLAPIRHSRDFRLLYLGQAGSSAGSVISYVALPYQAYQMSRSSLVVGLLSFAELLPLLIAGLLGGTLADAIERRGLILLTQAAAACCVAGLVVNALAWRQLWLLFVLAALLAGAFGLQRPSVEVLVPMLVDHDDLPGSSALSGLLGTLAQTAGPLLGGALLVAGLPLAYGVSALACVTAIIPFAAMRACPPAQDADRPSARGLVAGLRYAKSRPDLLGTYLIDIGAMFFGAPYAVFPQLAAGLGGPAVLGLLYAAPGFGSLAVSLTSTWTRHVVRHGRAITLAVCGWGLAIAAFAYAPGLPLAVLALAAAGGADMVSGIFRMTMWNQTIPARVRGRLAGLEMISYSTGEPLGNLETGALATLTGSVRLAVVSGGILSLAGAVIVSLALPALWRYDSRDRAPAVAGPEPAAAGLDGLSAAVRLAESSHPAVP
ncbi:MAG TPA: MFS transporter [Streptosporangiaceae bacterium]|nr:MFS transporter [Streptosporangiaceae bacterium]